MTRRDTDKGYLKQIVEYRKAINELNFRKGAILHSNSIFLAEGEWNPEAYEDARIRGEAMSRALDNAHLRTVPEEFVGGPDVNSWESLGSLARPFEPGALESVNQFTPGTVISEPGTTVPVIPPENSNQMEIPKAAEEPPASAEPVKPKKSGEFLDPVHYQSQLNPKSTKPVRAIATGLTNSVREEPVPPRRAAGRAQLQ